MEVITHAPLMKVAVRDAEGRAHLFRLQHEEIQTQAQAIALTQGEFPGARVVLALIETPAGLSLSEAA